MFVLLLLIPLPFLEREYRYVVWELDIYIISQSIRKLTTFFNLRNQRVFLGNRQVRC